MIADLKQFKLFIFDLDGTVYLGNKPVEGAIEAINTLTGKGYQVAYLTNNTSRSRAQIKDKLKNLGIKHDPAVYSAQTGAIDYVRQQKWKTIFCIGSDELKKELSGFCNLCTDPNVPVDALILAMDFNFGYQTLATALHFYDNNPHCKVIALNKDKNFPTDEGRMPGCGTLIAALEAAFEREVDVLIGKPDSFLLEQILSDFNLAKDEIVVIGDSMESDIKMAEAFGCHSILVENDCNFLLEAVENLASQQK